MLRELFEVGLLLTFWLCYCCFCLWVVWMYFSEIPLASWCSSSLCLIFTFELKCPVLWPLCWESCCWLGKWSALAAGWNYLSWYSMFLDWSSCSRDLMRYCIFGSYAFDCNYWSTSSPWSVRFSKFVSIYFLLSCPVGLANTCCLFESTTALPISNRFN